MRFDIMTLFPELVDTVLSESIIGRARKSGAIEVNTYNIRDYSADKHRRVDDTPYGGGKGMLMSPVPIYACYENIVDPAKNGSEKKHVVYMSPRGAVLTQAHAKKIAENYDNLIILCGHYEGVDQRIIDEIVDEEISIGDYVLTGGEIPACILVDCVARMIDGVLSSPECFEKESFSDGKTVEYPQYTRPPEWRGRKVPEVLIGGHHAKIEQWRKETAEELTKKREEKIKEENK